MDLGTPPGPILELVSWLFRNHVYKIAILIPGGKLWKPPAPYNSVFVRQCCRKDVEKLSDPVREHTCRSHKENQAKLQGPYHPADCSCGCCSVFSTFFRQRQVFDYFFDNCSTIVGQSLDNCVYTIDSFMYKQDRSCSHKRSLVYTREIFYVYTRHLLCLHKGF